METHVVDRDAVVCRHRVPERVENLHGLFLRRFGGFDHLNSSFQEETAEKGNPNGQGTTDKCESAVEGLRDINRHEFQDRLVLIQLCRDPGEEAEFLDTGFFRGDSEAGPKAPFESQPRTQLSLRKPNNSPEGLFTIH